MDQAAEQHRHRCEVLQLIRWGAKHGVPWVRDWLAGVAQKRGQAAADALRDDANAQRRAGNVGYPGDWRTTDAAEVLK